MKIMIDKIITMEVEIIKIKKLKIQKISKDYLIRMLIERNQQVILYMF